MRTNFASRVLGYALLAFFCAAPSAALAQAKSVAPQPSVRNTPPPLSVLYVADGVTSAIGVFRLDNGQQIASIAYPMAPGGTSFGGGVGVATDPANNLYAGYVFDNGNNYPGKTVIFGYAPGQIHWFTKIDGGCCTAPNLAISNSGEIAEALGDFGSCCQGGVGFVEPGKRYVGRFSGTLVGADYAAYDANGALWVDGQDQNFKGRIGIIRRGSRAFETVSLRPKPQLGPLAVDPANHVLIDNDGMLYAYDRHGNLAYTVTLTGASGVDSIALSRDGKTLYAAEQSGTVLAYGFPRGGKPVATYNVGGAPVAIALGSI